MIRIALIATACGASEFVAICMGAIELATGPATRPQGEGSRETQVGRGAWNAWRSETPTSASPCGDLSGTNLTEADFPISRAGAACIFMHRLLGPTTTF